MRKVASALCALMFLWLQTYQLCDASEDTVENLPIATQLQPGDHAVLSTPVSPEDDDDGAIPSVFDQTLMHDGQSLVAFVLANRWRTITNPVVLTSLTARPDVQNLSPPHARGPCLVGHSKGSFIPSARPLAPPLG